MKANYKNWIPKGMIWGFGVACGISFVLCLLVAEFGVGESGVLKIILELFFCAIFIILAAVLLWSLYAYQTFSYKGKKKLSDKIIKGVAEYITIPRDGIGLDVGCGSGALTIACAKKNPEGNMIGIDRWGKEYASYDQKLCEENAKAEQIVNTKFIKGNAIELEFENETFDAVTSNYVYHNIPGVNKQVLLKETLRTLKKGGVFAIHDLMTPSRYGDMTKFVSELMELGYEKVELIPTSEGLFMNQKEAAFCMLKGSFLLIGKK